MRPSAILLFLATAGATAWGVWEHFSRTDLETKVQGLTEEVDRLRQTAAMKVALASTVETHPDGPRGFNADGSPIPDDEGTPEVKKQKGPDTKAVEQARTRMKSELEEIYADLWPELELAESDRARLMAMIVERSEAPLDAIASAAEGEADSDRHRANIVLRVADVDRRIRDLLEEKAEKFTAWDASVPDRTFIRKFSAELKKKNVELPPGTVPALIAAASAARKENPLPVDFTDPARADLTRLNDRSLSDFLRLAEKQQTAISDRVMDALRDSKLPLREVLAALDAADQQRMDRARETEDLLRALLKQTRTTD